MGLNLKLVGINKGGNIITHGMNRINLIENAQIAYHSQIGLHSQITPRFCSQIIPHSCSQITHKDWSKISQSLMFTCHSQSFIVGHIIHIPSQIVRVFCTSIDKLPRSFMLPYSHHSQTSQIAHNPPLIVPHAPSQIA